MEEIYTLGEVVEEIAEEIVSGKLDPDTETLKFLWKNRQYLVPEAVKMLERICFRTLEEIKYEEERKILFLQDQAERELMWLREHELEEKQEKQEVQK